jgi:hypothetical protein
LLTGLNKIKPARTFGAQIVREELQ